MGSLRTTGDGQKSKIAGPTRRSRCSVADAANQTDRPPDPNSGRTTIGIFPDFGTRRVFCERGCVIAPCLLAPGTSAFAPAKPQAASGKRGIARKCNIREYDAQSRPRLAFVGFPHTPRPAGLSLRGSNQSAATPARPTTPSPVEPCSARQFALPGGAQAARATPSHQMRDNQPTARLWRGRSPKSMRFIRFIAGESGPAHFPSARNCTPGGFSDTMPQRPGQFPATSWSTA